MPWPIHEPVALRNPIRSYAWGSHSELARILGQPVPSAEPQAELWVGAHPSAPSQVCVDGEWQPLDSVIARNRDVILGSAADPRFGGQFPFLLKIIAVAAPLSIQVHPDAVRARRGFEVAERAGLAADRRCYHDVNPKPELLCALTPFDALIGLREPGEVIASLEALALDVLGDALARLRGAPNPDGLRDFCRDVLSWRDPGDARRATLLAGLRERAAQAANESQELSLVSLLLEHYPEDVGCLAPCLLRRLTLAPGESVYVEPGQAHAYLSGVGVEIMANSDNVVRAGLTSKHVDLDEWVRIVRFDAASPRPQAGRARHGALRYESDCDWFELSSIRRTGAEPAWREARGGTAGPELWLCVAGEFSLRASSAGAPAALAAGEALLVPASIATLELSGSGQVFRARVPARE